MHYFFQSPAIYGHRATTVVAMLHENGITPAAPGRLLHCWEWVAGRWKMVSCAFVKFCEFVKYAKNVCIYIYVRILCIYLYTLHLLWKKKDFVLEDAQTTMWIITYLC